MQHIQVIMQKLIAPLLLFFLLIACRQPSPPQEASPQTIAFEEEYILPKQEVILKSKTALRFDSLGLVHLAEVDTLIAIQLIYATPQNFTGQILYGDLKEAYLHPQAAEAIVKAQQLLQEIKPGYRLIVYDATRPMSAQQKMWNVVKGTSNQIYVSNPARGGGLHNYGLAVDVGILDAQKSPLPMGTEIDHFGKEAHTTQEEQLVRNGDITRQEKENRELLRSVMRKAGFRSLHSEWWHFNICSREEAKRNFKRIE